MIERMWGRRPVRETSENVEDVAGSRISVVKAVVGCSRTNGPTEAKNESAQETIENIEDVKQQGDSITTTTPYCHYS